jgi:hypothetical protein
VQPDPFAGQQVAVDHFAEQGVTDVVAVLVRSGHTQRGPLHELDSVSPAQDDRECCHGRSQGNERADTGVVEGNALGRGVADAANKPRPRAAEIGDRGPVGASHRRVLPCGRV